MEPEPAPLLKVCRLLNEGGARYLIAGAHAGILHGHVRTTEDVDILIEEDEDNFRRVIHALAKLEDGAAAELTPADLRENVVVKIADEVEVDITRRAWKIGYGDAIGTAESVEIEGVRVPFLGLECLIASKQTPREQDRADVEVLRRLPPRPSRR